MLLVMNEWETSRSYTCVHVLVWACSRPGCVSLLHFLVRLLSEGHSSPHFHTENVLLRVPWDLQLNSIHLLPLEDDVGGDGGELPLCISRGLGACAFAYYRIICLKMYEPFMLFCQISHKLGRSIIQGGWQKIIVDKTWSAAQIANYWW